MANILIFGAGAVGQFIGGLLQKAGNNKVSFVGRVEHFDAIRREGLFIKGPRGTESVGKLSFYMQLSNLPPKESFDWIFLTVKGYDLKKAVLELKNVIKDSKNVRFLLFQRGIDSYISISKIIPPDRLFFASLTANVAVITPGTVNQVNSGGALCLAPFERKTPLTDLTAIFQGIQLKIKQYRDFNSMKWSATVYEMLTDAFCALGDYTPEKLLSYSSLFELEMKAFNEALLVAKKRRVKLINLPYYNLGKIRFLNNWFPGFMKQGMIGKFIANPKNTKVPTIKNDMEKGKTESEISFINGAISHFGKIEGVSTPANDFITRELIKVITGKTSWEKYRKKPAEILSAFNLISG